MSASGSIAPICPSAGQPRGSRRAARSPRVARLRARRAPAVLTIGCVLLAITLFYVHPARRCLARTGCATGWWPPRPRRCVFGGRRPSTLAEGSRRQDPRHASAPRRSSITIAERAPARWRSPDAAARRRYLRQSRDPSMVEGVKAAFRTLFAPPGSMIRIVGAAPMRRRAGRNHARPDAADRRRCGASRATSSRCR